MSHDPSVDVTTGRGSRSEVTDSRAARMGHGAAQQRLWQVAGRVSTPVERLTHLLDAQLGRAGLERGPWVVVAVIAGVAAWFTLPGMAAWLAAAGLALALALFGLLLLRKEYRPDLALALLAIGLGIALGIALIWARSATVGAPAIEYPQVRTMQARILEREEQPARERVRLVLAARDAEGAEAIKLRVNVPLDKATPAMQRGAVIRLTARLMPPAPPLVPGGYDFARTAWFQGLAAGWGGIAQVQRDLSGHVRSQLSGSAGSIAAAFASGDRGAIAEADEDAMRDAGLTHLLSISGLHVSAVIAAAYFLALKLLALWPWLARGGGRSGGGGVHVADRRRGAHGPQLCGRRAGTGRAGSGPRAAHLPPAGGGGGLRPAVVARECRRTELPDELRRRPGHRRPA